MNITINIIQLCRLHMCYFFFFHRFYLSCILYSQDARNQLPSCADIENIHNSMVLEIPEILNGAEIPEETVELTSLLESAPLKKAR